MRPALSIVVPVHNGGDLLDRQVSALVSSARDSGERVEIVLVDNRSTDGAVQRTVELHREMFPDIRAVDAPDRPGVSHSRNVGIRASLSDAIACCDADDEVQPSWVEAMCRSITETTPYVTGPLDIDLLNPPSLRESRGRIIFEDVALYAGVVPFAHGCNLGLHRSLIERVGDFDESFDANGGEDIEFGARVWHDGTTLRWVPSAVVAYRFRADWRSAYAQGRAYGRSERQVREATPYVPRARRGSIRSELRRLAWLARAAPVAARDRSSRARWLWVLSQLDGRVRGTVDAFMSSR